MGKGFFRTCLSLLMLCGVTQTQALQISSLSPQGEVARIRQVVVQFDEATVRLGDAQAPAPVAITCDDKSTTSGTGRWTTERSWTFNFAQDLLPGVRCDVVANEDMRALTGARLSGKARFRFSSGGPFVQTIVPYAGSRIEEDQHFILQLNGPATAESILANVWCGMRGIVDHQHTQLLVHQLTDAGGEAVKEAVVRLCGVRGHRNVELVFGQGQGHFTPSTIGDE